MSTLSAQHLTSNDKVDFLGFAELRTSPWEPRHDVVLYWSTRQTAGEFLTNCTHLRYAPREFERIEVIADDVVIELPEFADLDQFVAKVKKLLTDKHLVRFNTPDWSLVWIRPDRDTGLAEAQGFFSTIPSAMGQMVSLSASGLQNEVQGILEAAARAVA